MKNTTFIISSILLLGLGFYANKFQALNLMPNTFKRGDSIPTPLQTNTIIEPEFNLDNVKQLGELGNTTISAEVAIALKRKNLFLGASIGSTDFVFYAQGEVNSNIDLADLTDKDVIVSDDLIEIKLPSPRIKSIHFNMGKSEIPGLQQQAEVQAYGKIVHIACAGGILDKPILSATDELASLLMSIQPKRVRIKKPQMNLDDCIKIVSAQRMN